MGCGDSLRVNIPTRSGFQRGGSRQSATLHFVPRRAVFYKHFETYENVLSILLPQEIGAGLARLKTDECRHIDLGQRVSQRLRLTHGASSNARFNLTIRDTPSHWAAQEVIGVLRDLQHI